MACTIPGFPPAREGRPGGQARPRCHKGRLQRVSSVFTRHRTLAWTPLQSRRSGKARDQR